MATILKRRQNEASILIRFRYRSKTNLLIPELVKIEAKRTLLILHLRKSEAKRILFIPQIRKNEAERSLFIPQIGQIETKRSLFIPFKEPRNRFQGTNSAIQCSLRPYL